MVEYLDKAGLSYLWGKLKSWVLSQGFLTSHQSLAGYVTLSGEQTVTGKKTFSESFAYASTINAPDNTVIAANMSGVIQSPIPKYLWHDLFAFAGARGTYTRSFYYSTDGSTWTSEAINNIPFINKDGNSLQILNSTRFGARWVFSTISWCSARWLLIAFTYNATQATVTIKVEISTDNSTWTVIHNSSFKPSSLPYWLKLKGINGETYLRITITKATSDSGFASISAIKLLTTRWGDQGKGSEYEYPFNWDTNANITPLGDNARSLGTSSQRWKDVYGVTFHGALDGNAATATKATQDGSGNNIENTYLKTDDLPDAITGEEMDAVLEEEEVVPE